MFSYGVGERGMLQTFLLSFFFLFVSVYFEISLNRAQNILRPANISSIVLVSTSQYIH